MKLYILSILFLFVVSMSFSQEKMLIYNADRIMYESLLTDVDSIKFRNNSSFFNFTDGVLGIPVSEIDSITFAGEAAGAPDDVVYIMYNGDQVTVINPFEENVNITVEGCRVSVTAGSGLSGIEYRLSGQATDGSFTFGSDVPATLHMSDLVLASSSGAAVNVITEPTVTLLVSGENKLSDVEGSTQNGVITSLGNLVFAGSGELLLNSKYKHAVASLGSVTVEGGNVVVESAVTDGIHSEGFIMKGGTLDINPGSDGIDAGGGAVVVTNGTIRVVSTGDDVKGIKGDGIITINGGVVDVSVSGAQSKGMSSKKDILLNGGSVSVVASGKTVLESSGSGYDPSYCMGVKSAGSLIVNGGNVTVECTASNNGGKGLSADGDIVINDGIVSVTTAGNGETYTNESGSTDSYTSSCLKSDAGISILGGTVNCTSTGNGGKGISADGEIILGIAGADNASLILNVNTSGERFYVSGSSGGGGGRPGGGGWGGESADYANPKAIKSEGDFTVNSGTIRVVCSQSDEGGEGMESKSVLTINGGDIGIKAYDDCINASSHIQINGGYVYCVSSGNDAIDSNGTLTISGGTVIANGTSSPEGGFDCDNNRFTISGGIVVGTGGSNSTPNAGTQKSVRYTAAVPGEAMCIKNASGDVILMYQLPVFSSSGGGGVPGGGSSRMDFVFSDPELVPGSYTLHYGGTISGGTTLNGYNTGGTYSGGSTKNFTVGSSVLTSI